MKTDLCNFSQFKIYPGHGRRVVKADLKTMVFINRKCERSFAFKRNPRNICWTVLYRRKNKKGQTDVEIKKKSRKLARFQRAITGATLDDIMKKRNQKPEVRKAQRDQAIRAAKDVKKAKAVAAKKAAPAKAAAAKAKTNVPKVTKAAKGGSAKQTSQR